MSRLQKLPGVTQPALGGADYTAPVLIMSLSRDETFFPEVHALDGLQERAGTSGPREP